LQARLNDWWLRGVQFTVSRYRHLVSRLIAEVVKGWDADEISRKIELEIGSDLQCTSHQWHLCRRHGRRAAACGDAACRGLIVLIEAVLEARRSPVPVAPRHGQHPGKPHTAYW
jgi:hypothetical protein